MAEGGSILVVDDDGGLRAAVAALLEADGHAVQQADSGAAALSAAWAEEPALVVLDVNLPGTSGYEVCRELRRRYGDRLPILFVSGERVESFDRVAGLLLGADDYLVKPFCPDELRARVRALLRRAGAAAPDARGLTRREREVLGLLAQGLTSVAVAARLSISPKTVGSHIERIHAKLGVTSRAQAVAVAYRSGLVEARPD